MQPSAEHNVGYAVTTNRIGFGDPETERKRLGPCEVAGLFIFLPVFVPYGVAM